MKRNLCSRCKDYYDISGQGDIVRAYSKPVEVAMVPVYINKQVEGKRKWIRVGLYCPRCQSLEEHSGFKQNRHYC